MWVMVDCRQVVGDVLWVVLLGRSVQCVKGVGRYCQDVNVGCGEDVYGSVREYSGTSDKEHSVLRLLPMKKRRRPVLLGEVLDAKVQQYLGELEKEEVLSLQGLPWLLREAFCCPTTVQG